jgi:hypothetical protein
MCGPTPHIPPLVMQGGRWQEKMSSNPVPRSPAAAVARS